MAEGNSYTFAVIVILGLVALFFIYWYSTSRGSSNKMYQPSMMQENYSNNDNYNDDDDQENFSNGDDDEDHEDFGNMQEVSNSNEDGVSVSGKVGSPSKDELYRMAHAQNFPPETKKPMNGDLVGQNFQTEYSQNPALQQFRQAACFPKEMLTPEELKPQDNSSLWAQVNPQGEGSLKGRSFLQAGHHIGINTVGQTLRNANMQLRSEPPNPQVLVSPWNQTTIEPDVNRRPLEIGGCA